MPEGRHASLDEVNRPTLATPGGPGIGVFWREPAVVDRCGAAATSTTATPYRFSRCSIVLPGGERLMPERHSGPLTASRLGLSHSSPEIGKLSPAYSIRCPFGVSPADAPARQPGLRIRSRPCPHAPSVYYGSRCGARAIRERARLCEGRTPTRGTIIVVPWIWLYPWPTIFARGSVESLAERERCTRDRLTLGARRCTGTSDCADVPARAGRVRRRIPGDRRGAGHGNSSALSVSNPGPCWLRSDWAAC